MLNSLFHTPLPYMSSPFQNGPAQFFSGSELPLHEEKHNEELHSTRDSLNEEQPDSDSGSDTLEFPEVPKVSVRPNPNVATVPDIVTPPAMPPPEVDLHSSSYSGDFTYVNQERVEERSTVHKDEPHTSFDKTGSKQFVPFISPPSVSPGSYSAGYSGSPPSLLSTKSEAKVDLQDVLAAANAAAESAERAAAAARSAASLAQVRINELTKKKSEHVPDSSSENPFYVSGDNESTTERGHFNEPNIADNSDGSGRNDLDLHHDHYTSPDSHSSSFPSFGTLKADFDSSLPTDHAVVDDKSSSHQPKRLPSMDEDPYFSYPNLFTPQNSNVGSHTHSDSSRSTHDL